MGLTGIDGLSRYESKHVGSWGESLERQFHNIIDEDYSYAMAA